MERKFNLNVRKKLFYCESHQTLSQVAHGSWRVSILWDIQNLSSYGSEQPGLVDPGLSRGVGLADFQRSLPTSAILWVWDQFLAYVWHNIKALSPCPHTHTQHSAQETLIRRFSSTQCLRCLNGQTVQQATYQLWLYSEGNSLSRVHLRTYRLSLGTFFNLKLPRFLDLFFSRKKTHRGIQGNFCLAFQLWDLILTSCSLLPLQFL